MTHDERQEIEDGLRRIEDDCEELLMSIEKMRLTLGKKEEIKEIMSAKENFLLNH